METFAYKGKQRKRKNVVITLDPELVEKAHKLGLNISKICEFSLNQAIKALEETLSGKGTFRASDLTWWWTGRDLNPRPPPCEGGIHSRLNYRPWASRIMIAWEAKLIFC